MVDLILFNFIFYNFQQFGVKSSVIFHCWQPKALLSFSQLAYNENLYMQYVTLQDLNSTSKTDFEYNYFKFQRPIVGAFLDMNCPQTELLLNWTSYFRVYSEHFHWLIYDREADLANFRHLFENANLSVNADLSYVTSTYNSFLLETSNVTERSTSLKLFTLYDVYNNGRHIGGTLNVTLDRRIACNVKNCFVERYLSNLYKRTKFGNRDRQHDITLRVAVIITRIPITVTDQEKIEFLLSENNTYVDALVRFGYRQIILIQDILQCNVTLSFFDRWSSTETGGGGVGALLEEKVDLGSTPNAITLGRLKVFTALAETGIFHSSCIFRTPRNTGLGNAGEVFLEPFDISVWILFGILLLLTAILLWGVFFVESKRMLDYLSYAPSLLTSLLITFGTACIQGTYLMPSSVGGRMAYAALAFASFMMYNYYTSVIVSILLGDPIKSDIKTVTQLADSPLEVGFESIPFNIAYLNFSTLPGVRHLVDKKIRSKKNPQSVWMSTEDGVLRVRDDPGFVFVFEASTGFALVEKYFKPEEICDLNEIFLRPERSLSTMLRQNSTYRELFRLRLTRLLETGINRRHLQYWLRDRLHCFASNLVVDVGLEYTAPLFLLMLGSYVLCVMVLALELIWKYYGITKFENLCCEVDFSEVVGG